MARGRNALGDFVTGFLTAFVVVSIVRDRGTGVRAGLVWGAVSAAVGWVVTDKPDGVGHLEDPAAEDQAFGGTETSD